MRRSGTTLSPDPKAQAIEFLAPGSYRFANTYFCMYMQKIVSTDFPEVLEYDHLNLLVAAQVGMSFRSQPQFKKCQLTSIYQGSREDP